MSIILNLFGEAVRYWICDIPKAQFIVMEQDRAKNNLNWEEFFFDLTKLKQFGFGHWDEMANRGEFKCFPLNNRNRIEIKKKNKTLERLVSSDLYNSNTFFPLYRTEIIRNFKPQSLEGFVTVILSQKESGLVAKYKINSEDFLFHDLVFQLIEKINGIELNSLAELSFKGDKLVQIGEDTVVRGFEVFSISPSL